MNIKLIALLATLLFASWTVSAAGTNSGGTNSGGTNSAGTNSSAQDSVTQNEVMGIGEQAHQDHCYKCHSDDIYKREDRVVKSISALGKQVRRCKDGIGIPWFDEDTDAVVQFLNEKYYKF